VILLDLSLPTPAENLALDEALLDVCDAGGPESLRFWESPVPFVVVGYGNRIATEVNVTACEADGVPILRRCSGGGTVVQGPGCLNYNLVLRIPEDGPLTNVTGTNRFIMERMRDALQPLRRERVVVEGHTDLGVEWWRDGVMGSAPRLQDSKTPALQPHAPVVRKFSGNAQRRRRRALVFHGTLLLDFNLSLIPRLLNHPSAEPDYRASRGHQDFVTNLALDRSAVRQVIAQAWNAEGPSIALPELAATVAKYESDEWNRRL
jgi:lipoate---protein ligase